jgi:GTPase
VFIGVHLWFHCLFAMTAIISNWAAQIHAGDIRAISRAITAIEDRDPQAEELLRRIFPQTGQAFVIGVTGAPGTGKSTLVDRLAGHYRGNGSRVGIIAVDPTSPYTGGAILGDRIRMQGHASDPGIFIRSMATRGFLGGLARTTSDVALVLDAAGKHYILIETVGVGQDEVDIVRLADCTLVLLVPGMGDDVQNMKAGLMEIADIFVLNKSDREGVNRLEAELQAMLQLAPERDGWKPKIVRTVATENTGVEELASAIAEFRKQSADTPARQERKNEHWKRRLLALAEEQVLTRAISGSEGEATLDRLAREVARRGKDPYTAVRELLSRADAARKGA